MESASQSSEHHPKPEPSYLRTERGKDDATTADDAHDAHAGGYQYDISVLYTNKNNVDGDLGETDGHEEVEGGSREEPLPLLL